MEENLLLLPSLRGFSVFGSQAVGRSDTVGGIAFELYVYFV